MIGLLFDYFGEVVEVRIKDKNVFFRTSQFQRFATIEGIKINKSGALKEHPDLKDREDWKSETIKRFREKINKMKTEEEIYEYIKEDLRKFGYKPLIKQRQGFRPTKLI